MLLLWRHRTNCLTPYGVLCTDMEQTQSTSYSIDNWAGLERDVNESEEEGDSDQFGL